MRSRVCCSILVAVVVASVVGCNRKPAPTTISDKPRSGLPTAPTLKIDSTVSKPKPAKLPIPENSAPDSGFGVTIAIASLNGFASFENGKLATGPKIDLRLKGAKLAQVKAVRTIVDEVKDEAGNPLMGHSPIGVLPDDDGVFRASRRPFGTETRKGDEMEFEQKLEYYAPTESRFIKSLKGRLELLVPTLDPEQTVTAKFDTSLAKPLDNPLLKAAEVEFILKPSTQENTILYVIKDPKDRVGAVEFVDARGTLLDLPHGVTTSGFKNQSMHVSLRYADKLPDGLSAKIYMVSKKSIVAVPFEFKDVPMPLMPR